MGLADEQQRQHRQQQQQSVQLHDKPSCRHICRSVDHPSLTAQTMSCIRHWLSVQNTKIK